MSKVAEIRDLLAEGKHVYVEARGNAFRLTKLDRTRDSSSFLVTWEVPSQAPWPQYPFQVTGQDAASLNIDLEEFMAERLLYVVRTAFPSVTDDEIVVKLYEPFVLQTKNSPGVEFKLQRLGTIDDYIRFYFAAYIYRTGMSPEAIVEVYEISRQELSQKRISYEVLEYEIDAQYKQFQLRVLGQLKLDSSYSRFSNIDLIDQARPFEIWR